MTRAIVERDMTDIDTAWAKAVALYPAYHEMSLHQKKIAKLLFEFAYLSEDALKEEACQA